MPGSKSGVKFRSAVSDEFNRFVREGVSIPELPRVAETESEALSASDGFASAQPTADERVRSSISGTAESGLLPPLSGLTRAP